MKRLICIIFSIAAALALCPLPGLGSPDITLRWSAEKLEEGTLAAYVSGAEDGAVVVLASYGKDMLLGVNTAVVKDNSASLEIEVGEVGAESVVKLFLWDRSSLAPLTEMLSTLTPEGVIYGAAIKAPDIGAVAGVVYIDGKGASGVTVRLVGEEERTAVTDERGAYLFEDVPAGEYTVEAVSPDNTEAVNGNSAKVMVEHEKTASADFEFKTMTGSVSGTVKVDGKGASDITVKLSDRETKTNEDGIYLFEDVVVGEYTVTADIPENTEAPNGNSAKVMVEHKKTASADFEFKTMTGSVSGYVKVDGKGASGVRVKLGGDKETKTDEDGAYLFEDVPVGEYEITADIPEDTEAPNGNTAKVMVEHNKISAVDFEFKTIIYTGSVSGIVKIDGKGADRITVTLSGSEKLTAITGADGKFAFSNVPVGEYDITVDAPKEATAADPNPAKVMVERDKDTVLELLFETETGFGAKIDVRNTDIWASLVPEAANIPANIVDGDLSTKWTASGVSKDTPQNITAYLGGTYTVSGISLAFGEAETRDYVFSVSTSYDGVDFKEVLPETVAARTNDLQSYALAGSNARFVRINMLGRLEVSAPDWVQLTEAGFYGREVEEPGGDEIFADDFFDLDSWKISAMTEIAYTDYTPFLGSELYAESAPTPLGDAALHLYDNVGREEAVEGEKLSVRKITASQTPESANPPSSAIDGDFSTKWTASGVTDAAPAVLNLELDGTYYISKAVLGFGVATERTYVFSLELSEDGRNYTKVIDHMRSSRVLGAQEFGIMQTKARYARFTFYKRVDSSNNGWIQITEVQLFGSENEAPGAGGILAQRQFTPPKERTDYEIEFDLLMPSTVGGGNSSSFYSGISLTDGSVRGGDDFDHYAAVQLRFEDENGKLRVKQMTSNYFNEGDLRELFKNSFEKDENLHIKIRVSSKKRRAYVTISDSWTSEMRTVNFAYSDDEKTRSSHWTYLEVNTLVINTGAGAKNEIYVSNLSVSELPEVNADDISEAPKNGIVRLEAIRLSSYPTSSSEYYGRYIYHKGENNLLGVRANIDPANTRFVERPGLMGIGVSFEAVSEPGCFLVIDNGGIYLKRLEENVAFYANATFIKHVSENIGYYTGETYSYTAYVNPEKYIYDSSSDRKVGDLRPWSVYEEANSIFYLRSEVDPHVSDNFYGETLNSQWRTNYPWKDNNPTNDSYNFSALITYKNVILENGELFLKATKASGWPTDKSGETGINYNKWGKTWERWKGYVGVVSIPGKVYNRESYIEGSFKQPESPIGYWNAFWLNGRDNWPPEIDIFEFLSSSYGHNSWHTAVHGQNDTNNLFGRQYGPDLTNTYHTFALDWGYDYMKFYRDGQLFASAQNNATVNYQKNLYLILNTGIGGWEAEPDDTMIWDDGMRVKYIRSFQY